MNRKVLDTLKKDGPIVVFQKLIRRILGIILRKLIKVPSSNKWLQLKNKYKDQTVYLIGNGPSLNKTPLYLLKNKNTIVFNRFNLMLERLNWNPTFYSVTDDLVLEDILDEAEIMTRKSKYAFFPDISFRGKIFFKKFNETLTNIYWLKQNPKLGFSKAMPEVHSGGTVIYEGIQILNYLGFNKIVLIGVDMNYKIHKTAKTISTNSTEIISTENDDPNHFDPRYFGKGKKYHQPEQRIIDNIMNSLEFLNEFINPLKLSIVNAGIDSKVNIFPRVDLEKELNLKAEEVNQLFNELLEHHGVKLEEFQKVNLHMNKSLPINSKFKLRQEDCLKNIGKLCEKYTILGPYENYYYLIKNESKKP